MASPPLYYALDSYLYLKGERKEKPYQAKAYSIESLNVPKLFILPFYPLHFSSTSASPNLLNAIQTNKQGSLRFPSTQRRIK